MDTYEKKYNEALNWMRELYPGLHGATKEDAEHFFPELRESEDERLRKLIIDRVRSATEMTEGLRELLLTYLEKQKEQKPSPKFKVGDTMRTKQEAAEEIIDGMPVVVSIDEDYYICNNEKIPITDQEEYEFPPMNTKQNPAEWSEEDERIACTILNLLCSQVTYVTGQGTTSGKQFPTYAKERDWFEKRFKSLRPYPYWKPSEQEKGALRTAVHVLTEERNFPKAASHLQAILDAFDGKESRKDWKPSEKQMKALKETIDFAPETFKPKCLIESLYECLKKMM